MEALGLPADGRYYKAVGCKECGNTGYLGRIAVAEVLAVSDRISLLMADGAPVLDVEDAARKEGFYDMREAGRRKVIAGITTIDEFRRVLG